VYIESDLITNGYCVDVPTLNSSIPYLGKISFWNVPYGFTGTYQATEAELQQINYAKRFGPTSVRIFDMKITDRYGNILPLPDNCFIDMHLVVFYNPSRD